MVSIIPKCIYFDNYLFIYVVLMLNNVTSEKLDLTV